MTTAAIIDDVEIDSRRTRDFPSVWAALAGNRTGLRLAPEVPEGLSPTGLMPVAPIALARWSEARAGELATPTNNAEVNTAAKTLFALLNVLPP